MADMNELKEQKKKQKIIEAKNVIAYNLKSDGDRKFIMYKLSACFGVEHMGKA